jgi:hypothetical protein
MGLDRLDLTMMEETSVIANASLKGFDRIKSIFGAFTLTDYERILIDYLIQRLPEDEAGILTHQISRFNQTDRLLKEKRGELPAFGHTSFYRNIFGKTSWKFDRKFPVKSDIHVLATMDVINGSNVIRVEYVLVKGIFFSMKYRSTTGVYVPLGEFDIENFLQHPF